MSTSILSVKRVAPLPEAFVAKPHWPSLCATLILGVDVLTLAVILQIFFRDAPLGLAYQSQAIHSSALVSLFLVLYYVCDLYPGICGNPVDEIRQVFLANSCACFFISVLLMHSLGRLGLATIGTCVTACFAIPVSRRLVRTVGSKYSWWGYPIAVFGSGEAALSLLRKLKSQPFLGFRPVAIVTDRIAEYDVDAVPVCSLRDLPTVLVQGVKHAVVAAPELSPEEFAEVLESGQNVFPHIIIIPDNHIVWKTGAYTRDLMGTLGLQVRNNLLRPSARIAKRVIDLVLCALLSPVVLPVLAVVYLLIAIEAGFPVFYSQERLGHCATSFRIWKFRTMVRNASEVLEQTLARDPQLREEWDQNQKLRKDPRITAIGTFLRKTSLDELPQFWNVVRGDMSLVGPRPIVESEIARYREAYGVYTKTSPGVTGLWQVSGRNHTTYAERVAYDTFYVRNWSVWMDLYLLARTAKVIFTGAGAY